MSDLINALRMEGFNRLDSKELWRKKLSTPRYPEQLGSDMGKALEVGTVIGANIAPGVGDALSLKQGWDDTLQASMELRQGELFKALKSGGLSALGYAGALPLVPALGSIATKFFRGADMANEAMAWRMYNEGIGLDAIEEATGWRMPSGKAHHPDIPFFEVDDSKMFVKKLPDELTPLKEEVYHPVFMGEGGIGDVPFKRLTWKDRLEYGLPDTAKSGYIPAQTANDGTEVMEQIWIGAPTKKEVTDSVLHEGVHAWNKRMGIKGTPQKSTGITKDSWRSYVDNPDELAARASVIRRLWSAEKKARIPFTQTMDEVHADLVKHYSKKFGDPLENPVSPLTGVVE